MYLSLGCSTFAYLFGGKIWKLSISGARLNRHQQSIVWFSSDFQTEKTQWITESYKDTVPVTVVLLYKSLN